MNYTGIKTIEVSEDQLAHFYGTPDGLSLNCRINEYVVLSFNKELIGPYKWNGSNFQEIHYSELTSHQFGTVKPKDLYQQAYIDSLNSNQFTVATGKAGSAKSYLALAYFFKEFESGHLDRMVMFSNPLVAKDAARLGFYPGDPTEKILFTSIGGILTSKLGSRIYVEEMIKEEQIILVPIGDARGYQVPEKSFVYFSEFQNTNIQLAKLFLSRITDSSKVVAEGDICTQVDSVSFDNGSNGLRRTLEVFGGMDYFGAIELQKVFRGRLAEKADEL
jgi:predicted ribonuclease YlaK